MKEYVFIINGEYFKTIPVLGIVHTYIMNIGGERMQFDKIDYRCNGKRRSIFVCESALYQPEKRK